jgi:hypothetical protein
VHTLSVGESVLIPWPVDERGRPLSLRPAINAVCMYRSRSGREFQWAVEPGGLRVIRVK